MKTRNATSFNYSQMPVKFQVQSNSGVTRTKKLTQSSASCTFLLILILMKRFLKRPWKRLSKMFNNSLLSSHSSLTWGKCWMYLTRISVIFWKRQTRSCISRYACASRSITWVLTFIQYEKSLAIYVLFKPTLYNDKHIFIVARNPCQSISAVPDRVAEQHS